MIRFYEIYNPEEEAMRTIDNGLPVVLFADAVDVTKNHRKYNMVSQKSIPHYFTEAAQKLITNLHCDCFIYAAIDELNFIFLDASQLISAYRGDNRADCVLTLFISQLTDIVRGSFPGLYFKGQFFQIEESNIPKYLAERERICKQTAAMYYAKEYLKKDDYHGKTTEEIIKALKMHENYYARLIENSDLYNGIYTRIKPETYEDTVLDRLSGDI